MRLVCGCSRCTLKEHDGVWTTSWTPRRLQDTTAPNDYRLTRETDGETTYATRDAIAPVETP